MWLVIFIIIGVALMSGHGMGGAWWIFLLPLLFIASGNSRRAARRWDRRSKYWGDDWGNSGDTDFEKPKRDVEKPKNSGQYVRSDDGELLEVIEDDPPHPIRDDEADADSDSFYV